MQAKVNVNCYDMKGKIYDVQKIDGRWVTLVYFDDFGQRILIDFLKKELQLINYYRQIFVHRNQADRLAIEIDYNPKYGYVFEYEMPNGKVFMNVLKDPDNPNDYKAISQEEYKRKFKNQ